MRIAVAGGTGNVGRHVVDAARGRGDEVVVLSRSRGVDVRSGQGLAPALEGVDAIVDVLGPQTTDEAEATRFFTETAGRLQAAAASRGVGHIVTVSIVGADRAAGYGYYAATLRHEEAALAGPVRATVMRATQFHEFAGQMLAWNARDGEVHIPRWRVQTVAARAVGRALLELAGVAPAGHARELAGPDQADLPDLVRRFAARRGVRVTVVADATDTGVPAGAQLPLDGAHIEGPTFDEWLASEDAAELPVPA